MRHLFTFMESDNLHVVSFIATFHQFEEGFWIIKGISHLWHKLLIVIVSELKKFTRRNLERLQHELDLFFFLFRLGKGVCLL